MKKLLAAMVLLASACSKDSSLVDTNGVNPQTSEISSPLSNVTFVANGTLDIQTKNVYQASLGIINYRTSYELCGTAGNNLLLPVTLPMSDSSAYGPNILADGDTLTAQLAIDTTLRKTYDTVSITIYENNVSVQNQLYFSPFKNNLNFAFHQGSKYEIKALVK